MPPAGPPPFERLYLAHRQEILSYLRRIAPRSDVEDAFQETFLRALAAYPRVRQHDHLRAWLFTIATRVAIDAHRRRTLLSTDATGLASIVDASASSVPVGQLDELVGLTASLPPTERAAVVLRYGYDLAYADIATALGSTPAAARQAASSGVRRLRRTLQPEGNVT